VQFTTDLTLVWSGATDPDLIDTLRYRVRVDTQATLASAVVYDSLATENLFVAGVLEFTRTYYWNVTVFDKGALAAASGVRSFRSLMAGDAYSDGQITTTDIIFLVNYTLKDGPAPDPVRLGDVNASCEVTTADIIYLVQYVFKSGPEPQVGCAVATRYAPRQRAAP
jgi:hypothetical protein